RTRRRRPGRPSDDSPTLDRVSASGTNLGNRNHPTIVSRPMRRSLAAVVLLVAACQAATPSPMPVASGGGGLQAFLSDLAAAGATAREAGTFDSQPVGGEGHVVCIGTETLNVYEFATDADARAAAARIDPSDPSHIGNAMVDWIGSPRFW